MKNLISTREHQRVLETCVDVPDEKPSFALPLTEVGISSKTVWVLLPQGRIPFTAKLSVNLPANRRGIHMSRMEEVISALYGVSFSDLKEYAVELGTHMIARQEAETGRVELSGKLPMLNPTSMRGRSSVDSVDVSISAAFMNSAGKIKMTSMMIGAGLNHITACPCTQEYNQVLFRKEKSDCPMPTHSQRSKTSLNIETSGETPTFEDLVACLESALHTTKDLLKRPDEAEIILKSHQKPQFAEDAVRETAGAAAGIFAETLDATSRVIIESVSLESIHIHDVSCRMEATMAEMAKCLGKKR